MNEPVHVTYTTRTISVVGQSIRAERGTTVVSAERSEAWAARCSCGLRGPCTYDVFEALRDRYDHLIETGEYQP